jgi:hypothetical protein
MSRPLCAHTVLGDGGRESLTTPDGIPEDAVLYLKARP